MNLMREKIGSFKEIRFQSESNLSAIHEAVSEGIDDVIVQYLDRLSFKKHSNEKADTYYIDHYKDVGGSGAKEYLRTYKIVIDKEEFVMRITSERSGVKKNFKPFDLKQLSEFMPFYRTVMSYIV